MNLATITVFSCNRIQASSFKLPHNIRATALALCPPDVVLVMENALDCSPAKHDPTSATVLLANLSLCSYPICMANVSLCNLSLCFTTRVAWLRFLLQCSRRVLSHQHDQHDSRECLVLSSPRRPSASVTSNPTRGSLFGILLQE